MRPLYFISTGFQLATPAYDDAGEPHIVLTSIVYFTPSYDTEDENDLSHTLVQSMPQGGWAAIEHPECQLVQRPDKLFISPEGLAGNETAAINYFREFREGQHRQRHPVQYNASILADFEQDN